MGSVFTSESEHHPPEIQSTEEVKFAASGFVQPSHESIRQKYQIQDVIGDGAFGKVRRAVHKVTNQPRAIKTISKDQIKSSKKEIETFLKEVDILRRMDHPNILRVFEFFEDKNNYHVVTELCTGGELFDRIIEKRCFNEQDAASVMSQVLAATVYCHSNGFAHRDLKPENIIYESKNPDSPVKVIDFGTAQVIDRKKKFTDIKGTPYYVAPEVLAHKYDEKCDIWSCGVILYVLLTGIPPFSGRNDNEILNKVRTGHYEWPEPYASRVTSAAKDLVSKMLTKDPNQRPKALECLNHAWIQNSVESQAPEDQELIASTFNNLKNFHATQKLQQAVYAFIAAQLTTSQEREELRQVFQSFDTNNDGKLSREELFEGYKSYMSEVDALAEVEKIMTNVDIDGNGFIDYTEFVAAAMDSQRLLSREKIIHCFKEFDKDGSGSISTDELKSLVSREQNISESV